MCLTQCDFKTTYSTGEGAREGERDGRGRGRAREMRQQQKIVAYLRLTHGVLSPGV